MNAPTLALLLEAGVRVEVDGERVRLREPRPGVLRPEHAPAVRALRGALLRIADDTWRSDLATWPSWRRDLYEERAALREYEGRQPRDLAERCAYLEAIEAPEPSAALAPTLALLLEAFPGARVEVRQRQPEPAPAEPPAGRARFQHRYRPPPEYPQLPPFRWTTLPPAVRGKGRLPPLDVTTSTIGGAVTSSALGCM